MIRLTCIICLLISLSAKAQYYYKDIVVPAQTMEKRSQYKSQKIRTVSVFSYENNGERSADFSGTQTISSDFREVNTSFNTPLSGESLLTTFFDAKGKIVKSIDTADGSKSTSEYFYDDKERLSKISNISISPGLKTEKEDHLWYYNNEGKPVRMLRIKNDVDTTYIDFVLDENGNVAEENSSRNKVHLPSYYYYYDAQNRLTDIVAYNEKAKRLLPLYIFEYTPNNRLASMLVVPEGTDDYQKWHYEYNAAGLKTKETAFNKRRQVLGRIEFEYR
jgi:hypothetical protein